MLHDSRCLFAAVLQRPRLNRKVSVELLCVFVGFRFRCQKAAELMTKQFANPIDKFFKLNMAEPRTTPVPDSVLIFLLPHRLQSAINHRPKWQCGADYGLPAALAAPVPAPAPTLLLLLSTTLIALKPKRQNLYYVFLLTSPK